MLRVNTSGIRRVLAAAIASLVVACGGGGAGSDGSSGGGAGGGGQPASGDYFPLDVGDVWYYTSNSAETTSVRVTRTRLVNGRTTFVTSTTDNSGTSEDLYEKSSSGIRPVPPAGADELTLASAKIPVLSLPLVSGVTQVPLDQRVANVGDLDGDGRAESATLRTEVTVLGFENLSTPAGSWTSVAHVRTVFTEVATLSSTSRTVTVTATSDDWYAPNIGLVRSMFSVVGGGVNESGQQSLNAFRVGSLRSETVAPSIATRSPAAGSVQQNLALSVQFTEAMDRFVSPADALILTGPNGQPLAGSVSWQDDRTLVFTPSRGLTSGTYQARASATLTDLVGNAISGALTWSFDIDRQGPMVVSMSPADGAMEVPLTSAVTIVFDEDPDPASVTPASVLLSDVSGPVAATLTLTGRTVVLTPQQALTRSRSYFITVSGGQRSPGQCQFRHPACKVQSRWGSFCTHAAANRSRAGLGTDGSLRFQRRSAQRLGGAGGQDEPGRSGHLCL